MVLQYETKPNPSYNPTFKDKSLVVLQKDYSNFVFAPDLPKYGGKHLTENRCCQVLSSGLSYYSADKNGNFTVLVENCELCYVKAYLKESEYEYHKYGGDLKAFTGIVRAADLRTITYDDVVQFRN